MCEEEEVKWELARVVLVALVVDGRACQTKMSRKIQGLLKLEEMQLSSVAFAAFTAFAALPLYLPGRAAVRVRKVRVVKRVKRSIVPVMRSMLSLGWLGYLLRSVGS